MSSWGDRSSPFIFEGPVPPDRVTGRDEEIRLLTDAALHGRPIGVVAPRRFGKTSLLLRVVQELRRDADMPGVLVDLYGVVSLADLAVRLERAYSHGLLGVVRRQVERVLRSAGLGLSLGPTGIAATLQRQPGIDPVPALHTLLDLPTRLGRRVYVVLDEFQSVMTIPNAEALFRSHLQHQREFASYVFAGSEPGLMDALFADRERPFFGQADVQRLGRLADAVLGDVVDDGFEGTGRSAGEALGSLLRTAEGHPQRAMLLAHALWNATPPGGVADDEAWEQALEGALARTQREAEVRYRGSVNRQRVLRAVAGWGTPFAGAARAALDLPKGSVTKAVGQLVSAGELERITEGQYRVVDPLFALWLRRLGAADAS